MNSPVAVAAKPVAESSAQKKKMVRRESTIVRQEKCAQQFSKNTSLSVKWNRAANHNRLFYTEKAGAKEAKQYCAIDRLPLHQNNSIKEMDGVRLRIKAIGRHVPDNLDKETTARKLSATNRFISTRMSVSDGDRNRVPTCDGDRLLKHVNAVVLLPASFDPNEPPPAQPNQAKDRRKSIHNISIGAGPLNRRLPTDPLTTQRPITTSGSSPTKTLSSPRPAVVPSTLKSAQTRAPSQMANPSIAPQFYVVRKAPTSAPNQLPNASPNMNGVTVPSTSAAALAASAPPPTVTSASVPLLLAQLQKPPAPIVANRNSVKVLSVTELNSRAGQMNNNDNRPSQNHITHVNGVKMKYVPTVPNVVQTPTPATPPPPPPPQPETPAANDDHSNVDPIHVTLIKRQGSDLELTLTQNSQKLAYDTLTESQRHEVQKSLLVNNVWKQMLEHIKVGSPSPLTLELFRRLLPPEEQKQFFSAYYAAKGLSTNGCRY